jgi:cephalosporin hydroxylase
VTAPQRTKPTPGAGIAGGQPIERSLSVPLADYYHDRLLAHLDESYLGQRMRKFPEDLHSYETILWEQSLDAVLELGTGHGASALWFRDRLATLARYRSCAAPRVVSVDRNLEVARAVLAELDPDYAGSITLLESDVRDPGLVERVTAALPAGARVLVVEDSAHMYDTTMAALTHFAHLVPPGGYFVVEDGHRDFPELFAEEIPSRVNGALVAVADWLRSAAGREFAVRRDAERYLVTTNPCGWLQRATGLTDRQTDPAPRAS